MVGDLISTLDSYLLTRIIYCTTHLAFIVTDYGQTLADDIDGKQINTSYGPFWLKATERFFNNKIYSAP